MVILVEKRFILLIDRFFFCNLIWFKPNHSYFFRLCFDSLETFGFDLVGLVSFVFGFLGLSAFGFRLS